MAVLEDLYVSRVKDRHEVIARQDPVIYGSARPAKGESLDEKALSRFERNGYLFIEKLFSGEEVQIFAGELERMIRTPEAPRGPQFITEPESGKVRSIFEIHSGSKLFRRLASDARIVNIARQILGSEVYIHQSRVNIKPGFEGKEFYWHSDFETWHVEDGMPRMRALSCSILLTRNYPFNGPLMLIPGSHHNYISCVGRTPENHYKQSLKKQEYGVPDHASLKWLVDDRGIDAPTGPAGSVVFFDCNLMHGSNGNITPYPRSNVFFVYNSVANTLVAPFSGLAPRPAFIASRDFRPVVPASGERIQPVPRR